VGQPAARRIEGLLAGQDLLPDDAALAAGGLRDRRIEHPGSGAPDVGTGAVAFDERDDGMVGDDPASVPIIDFGAGGDCRHGPHLTTKRGLFAGAARRCETGLPPKWRAGALAGE